MLATASIALSLLLGAAHPHLFFQSTDVPALRSAAATTHQDIATYINTVLGAHVNDPAPTPTDYSDPRFYGDDVCAWGFGYQLTGNPAYAAQGILHLETYLTWSDWSFGEISSSGTPDLNLGHMLIGVACAYDFLYEVLSNADRSAVATRLGTEAERMYEAWMSPAWYVSEFTQNHNWINSAGLGLAALALSGEDARAADWLAASEANLAKVALDLGPISDGSWHEGIKYQEYGVSMALPFWMALRTSGADYTNLGLLRGLGKTFLAAMIPDLPRQQLLLHGDFTGWPRAGIMAMLRFAAARFRDGTAEAAARRWLAGGRRSSLVGDVLHGAMEFIAYDPSVAPVDPTTLPLDTYLPDLQASVLHSSWSAGDLAVAFKAAPYGGRANFDILRTGAPPGGIFNWGHDHNDDMSFWLWGRGTWLAPEAAAYDAGKNNSLPVSSRANMTNFHNGLLVDGNGELGDLRASDSQSNNPWFWSRDAQTLIPANGTADYGVAGGRGATLYSSTLSLSRWDRVVILARNRYVLVRDDISSTATHTYDWICHFPDGANVDTQTGWVQGVAKNGMYLGVRVVSPAAWTATTGSQTANKMSIFDPDNSIFYVQVRPQTAAPAAQFLTALVPVAAAAWASRVRIDALSDADPGAGTVVAPDSALEERWIFGRAGGDGYAAGDLSLTSSLAGMAARNAGVPTRALLVGAGRLYDQSGTREILSSTSARIIEVDLQGSTLVVSGDGIADFRAYAPATTALLINGQPATASVVDGIVIYPALDPPPPPPPPPDPPDAGGAPDAGVPDAGGAPDAGVPDAGGDPDAGIPDAGGDPDAGVPDAGGDLDAGVPDAGGDPDAGMPDAGADLDAGMPDAGDPPDAGFSDAGDPSDAGIVDAGDPGDAGAVDAGDPDDAGAADAGQGGAENPPPPTSPPDPPRVVDAGVRAPDVVTAGAAYSGSAGCASGGATPGLELGVLLALAFLRRRKR